MLAYQGCRLLGVPCGAVRPEVVASGPAVRVTSGFPARPLPNAIYGYTSVMGEGIEGGDFNCSFSKVNGTCAFANVIDALFM